MSCFKIVNAVDLMAAKKTIPSPERAAYVYAQGNFRIRWWSTRQAMAVHVRHHRRDRCPWHAVRPLARHEGR